MQGKRIFLASVIIWGDLILGIFFMYYGLSQGEGVLSSAFLTGAFAFIVGILYMIIAK